MMPKLCALSAFLCLVLFAGASDAAKKPAGPLVPAACDDLYGNVNAAWLAAHPLPAGMERLSRWDELAAAASAQKQAMLAGTAGEAPGPASRLLADFVVSGLDEARLDAAGQAALKPLLERIAAIHKARDLAPAVAALQAAGVSVLFDFRAERDPDNGQPRGTFRADALGLPEPAFYTNPDPALREVAGYYRAYLGDLLKFSGVPGKQLAAQTSLALTLEEQLAKAIVEERVVVVPVVELGKRYPNLQLANALQAWGVAPAQVTLRQPGFFKAVDKLWAKPNLPAWQAYLRARVLQSLAPTLGQDYRRAYVALVDERLAKRLPASQAQRVAALVESEGTDLLNAAFAERALDAEAHRRADAIGAAVRAAMARAIDRAAWLSTDGKAAAHRQLDAMQLAVGRTPEPVDVSSLQFDPGQYAGNVLALRRWLKARDLARLSAPQWPARVSQAWPLVGYEAARNRVLVTAATLRAPVYSGRGDAGDYGALGALVGQQVSLAFAHLDGADGRAWRQRSEPLAAQLAAAGVDAERARAMSAADLAGLELAWDALTTQGPVSAGDKQAFFVAWASLWARHERADAVDSDVEFAPPRVRANLTAANLPDFAKAFSCKKKQALNRPAASQAALWR